MAGRIRTIKPELLEDAKTAKLGHGAWRLFVSGLLLADDFGVLRAEPGLLSGSVFWGAGGVDVTTLTAELVDAGLWQIYEVDGQNYAHVRNWSKHQRVDRPNENRRLPGPPDDVATVSREWREGVGNNRAAIATDHDHDQYHDPERDLARARDISCDRRSSIMRLVALQAELRNEIIDDGIDRHSRKFQPTGFGMAQPIIAALDMFPEDDLENALRSTAAEARGLGTLKYFDGEQNWKPDKIRRAKALTPDQAESDARERAGRRDDIATKSDEERAKAERQERHRQTVQAHAEQTARELREERAWLYEDDE